MSNETSGNSSKILIGILAIALIASWIYFSTSKTEIVTNYTTQIANLDSTKNVIQSEFIAASAKVDSLNQANTQLQGDLATKSNDIQQLKTSISAILKKKDITEKELATAKSLITDLNSKVTGLVTDLAKAQEENKQLNEKNQDLTNQNTTLATNLNNTNKEKERLQDLGSTLHASSFSLVSLRVKEDGSEKVTKSAKKANTIRLSFQIDKNKITPSGLQDLYICIVTPDGKYVADGGSFPTREDGVKVFSNKLTVQYEQNAILPVSFDIKQSNKFIEGDYKIQVYHNGFKIGEGKTTFQKGGWF
jgi:predicted  nucleic acid-binding Zn-ribbon protein